jgi:hypothetical protein
VAVSHSLGLTCPLHPDKEEVKPLCSWFVDSKTESVSPDALSTASSGHAARQPLSLTVQLFTTATQGQLRYSALLYLPCTKSSPARVLNCDSFWSAVLPAKNISFSRPDVYFFSASHNGTKCTLFYLLKVAMNIFSYAGCPRFWFHTSSCTLVVAVVSRPGLVRARSHHSSQMRRI